MDHTGFYRAMWRWHFYAGLIVLPVLALMAVMVVQQVGRLQEQN